MNDLTEATLPETNNQEESKEKGESMLNENDVKQPVGRPKNILGASIIEDGNAPIVARAILSPNLPLSKVPEYLEENFGITYSEATLRAFRDNFLYKDIKHDEMRKLKAKLEDLREIEDNHCQAEECNWLMSLLGMETTLRKIARRISEYLIEYANVYHGRIDKEKYMLYIRVLKQLDKVQADINKIRKKKKFIKVVLDHWYEELKTILQKKGVDEQHLPLLLEALNVSYPVLLDILKKYS
ncbi:hypothetical protein GF338_02055 [candidate division WOR-3 bacterium]|nr:hypothetical protein [candidate division WOR-3 bacterium]